MNEEITDVLVALLGTLRGKQLVFKAAPPDDLPETHDAMGANPAFQLTLPGELYVALHPKRSPGSEGYDYAVVWDRISGDDDWRRCGSLLLKEAPGVGIIFGGHLLMDVPHKVSGDGPQRLTLVELSR